MPSADPDSVINGADGSASDSELDVTANATISIVIKQRNHVVLVRFIIQILHHLLEHDDFCPIVTQFLFFVNICEM